MISSAQDLADFRDKVNNGEAEAWAKLTQDIPLSSENWTPIGKDENTAYKGTFDGGGFTISGLVINIEDSGTYKENVNVFAGLFGCIIGDETESGGNRGVVKNVKVADAKINVTITGNAEPCAGIIAGYCAGDIIGCTSSGSVNVTAAASYRVGGIAGNLYGSVTDCTNTASITFKDMESDIAGSVGGIVGYATSVSNIINCTNRGAVTGGACSRAGGIVSSFCFQRGTPEAAVIEGCENSGEVTGNQAGGIAGSIYEENQVVVPQISLTNCTNSGNVIGIGTGSFYIMVGGIVGFVVDSVVNLENSSTHGTVTSGNVAPADCGGIAGCLLGNAEVNADDATTWDKASNPTLTEIGDPSNYTTGATAQEQPMHKITAAAGVGGTITPDDEYWVIEGESQSFTITADEGYVIDHLLIDRAADADLSGKNTGTYTFSDVQEAHTIEAYFRLDGSTPPDTDPEPTPTTYTITTTASEGGTISPSGEISVTDGEKQTFTVKANEGYMIEAVTADGQAIAEAAGKTEYTFEITVTKSQTVSATFKLSDGTTPDGGGTTPDSGGGGGGCSAGFGALALLALVPLALKRRK